MWIHSMGNHGQRGVSSERRRSSCSSCSCEGVGKCCVIVLSGEWQCLHSMLRVAVWVPAASGPGCHEGGQGIHQSLLWQGRRTPQSGQPLRLASRLQRKWTPPLWKFFETWDLFHYKGSILVRWHVYIEGAPWTLRPGQDVHTCLVTLDIFGSPIDFNVRVRYFVWNFKGTLWNSTQNILPIHWNSTRNILPIHWKMCSLLRSEDLRDLRFKSS